MDCSRCGTPATPGDQTCRVCAAPLAQAVADQPAPTESAASTPPEAPVATAGAPDRAATAAVTPAAAAGTPHADPAVPASPLPAASPALPSPAAQGSAAPTASANPYAAYGAAAGYPAPQGYQGYQGYADPAAYASQYYAQYYAQAYASMYAYMGAYAPRPRPKGETYRQVLGAIVIFGSVLLIIGGLILGVLILVANSTPIGSGLDGLSTLVALAIAALAGGGTGIYYGVTAIMRRPSVRFSLPPPWLWLALTLAALAAGVVLWHTSATPGSAFASLPLVLLAGALPALTILAYGGWLLGNPSTWRHVMLSLIHGATLAVVLAAILEAIAVAVIVAVFGLGNSSLLSNLNNFNPSNGTEVVILLLVLSVVAPVVEEGLKPLGAILVMPRVRGPAEAFLLGLAAGVGFDFVETVGYFGMGQADWIAVAIDRIGAGLLHGVGAGMAALGWYYLLRGKGVSHRWLRGFGGIAYALLQHGIFNGSNFLALLPGPAGKFFSLPLYLGRLPLGSGTLPIFALYVIIFGVLTVVAWRLGRAARTAPTPQPSTTTDGTSGGAAGGASGGTASGASGAMPAPEPVAGGAR